MSPEAQEEKHQIRYGQDRHYYCLEKDNLATRDGVHLSWQTRPYQDITVPQFVYGYLLVMDSEEADIRVQMASHLKALISDAQLYGWESTRALHRVWLNCCSWGGALGSMRRPRCSLGGTSSGTWPACPLHVPTLPALHPGPGRGAARKATTHLLSLAPRFAGPSTRGSVTTKPPMVTYITSVPTAWGQ